MSDFGFDAYALDDVEPTGHPHPLEIARDLIATGKARSALEVLSVHHAQLLDDPEYLLLCSEAWRATDDVLRAQQALLEAARLAPNDPRPLQWLGELLAERGEHDKAKRLLAKARALNVVATEAEEPLDAMGPGAEDDLIAFAERRERSRQLAPSPGQVLFAVVALAGVVSLIAAVAYIASPREGASPAPGSATFPVEEPATSISTDELARSTVIDIAERESRIELLVEPEQALAAPLATTVETETPEPEPPRAMAPPAPATSVSKASRTAGATQTRKPVSSPTHKTVSSPADRGDRRDERPDVAVIQRELASMKPEQLTARADALYEQGHAGVAANYYRRALEIDPDYAPALVGMGRSILRAKKYSDAMTNAIRALELARGVDARPGLEAAAIYQMGRVHYERGERDAARPLFRQSISLPGTPAEAWFYLGEALASDNSPAAREAYEKYLELVSKGHLADRARRAIQ